MRDSLVVMEDTYIFTHRNSCLFHSIYPYVIEIQKFSKNHVSL